MILVDTSLWIDHLRRHDAVLAALLDGGRVLGHAFVRGELACGHLRQRVEILTLSSHLPQSVIADDAEVMTFIERHRLMGTGIGYIDAHLMAATVLTPDARLWTHDRCLGEAARRLGLEARPQG